MDERFNVWKNYLEDHQEALMVQPSDKDIPFEYVGETKVYSFGAGDQLHVGIWLQDKLGNLRNYVYINSVESIIWDNYKEEKKEGVMHKHDFIEIGYVAEGSAQQIFFGELHTFIEGDFWIVDRNCYHCDLHQKEELLTIYVGIPSDVFNSAMIESVGNSEISQFLSYALLEQKKNRQYLHFKPKGPQVKGGGLMEHIIREIIEHKAGSEDVARGYIIRLLEALATNYDFQLSSQEQKKLNDLLFLDIEHYIQEHYSSITIRDLVDHFHYNEDFYNRLFKEYAGMTYIKYLMNVKLEKAKEMLLSSEESIEVIALNVGYNSRGHFYRVFTKKYGTTPAKYRLRKH